LQEHDAIVNVAVLCAHLLHTSGRRDLRRPSNDPNWPLNDPDLDTMLATMLLPSPRPIPVKLRSKFAPNLEKLLWNFGPISVKLRSKFGPIPVNLVRMGTKIGDKNGDIPVKFRSKFGSILVKFRSRFALISRQKSVEKLKLNKMIDASAYFCHH
jgi:hypothetical protein